MRYFGIVLVVSRCRRVWRTLFANLGDSVPYSIASCKPCITQRASSRLNFDSLLGARVIWKSFSGLPLTNSSIGSRCGLSHRENARISSISMRDWRVDMIF